MFGYAHNGGQDVGFWPYSGCDVKTTRPDPNKVLFSHKMLRTPAVHEVKISDYNDQNI